MVTTSIFLFATVTEVAAPTAVSRSAVDPSAERESLPLVQVAPTVVVAAEMSRSASTERVPSIGVAKSRFTAIMRGYNQAKSSINDDGGTEDDVGSLPELGQGVLESNVVLIHSKGSIPLKVDALKTIDRSVYAKKGRLVESNSNFKCCLHD